MSSTRLAWRSSGIRPTPAAITLSGDAPASSTAPTFTLPPVGRRIPESTSTSSLCPFPETPATPTISPSPTVIEIDAQRRQAMGPVGREVGDAEDRLVLVRTGRTGVHVADDPERRTADHHPCQLALVGVARRAADEAPLAQDAHALRDRSHLAELVADEDDREAVADEAPQRREQRLDLLGDEHRGRLVEDEHAALTR